MTDDTGGLAAGLLQFLQTLWDGLTHASGDAWLQSLFALIGILVAGSTFLVQQHIANELQRKEVYQRLELASNDLFGFEADHAEALERFRDIDPVAWKFTPLELKALDNWDQFVEGAFAVNATADETAKSTLRQLEADWRKTRKYFEKALNLFEMAARLRKARILDPEVFGSWTIWFYETVCEWGFRRHWDTIKQNYTRELRNIFDYHVATFDPHADEEHRKRAFFEHVAKLYRCQVIADWLADIAAQDKRVAARKLPDYPTWLRLPRFGR